ncbi:MAG: 3'-5' exonuclease [Methylibium sp.]|nr:3'-5' exonuclease [Methylibium sp.]MBA3624043.1 3'-5' exonuclease [Methylibium sp.]
MNWLQRWRGEDGPQRWIVVDVETTGLDVQHCRLLAIAAVALRPGPQRIDVLPGDSFEVVLRPDAAAVQAGAPPDKANILLHGIGVGQQDAGVDAAQALREFDDYAAGAPRLGFHAAFDRAVLERAARLAHGSARRARWADLADLAPVLYPGTAASALDDWLALFGIECVQRHQAAADALATAELLQQLWPRVVTEGAAGGFAALERLAARRRWLAG